MFSIYKLLVNVFFVLKQEILSENLLSMHKDG